MNDFEIFPSEKVHVWEFTEYMQYPERELPEHIKAIRQQTAQQNMEKKSGSS